MRPLILLLACLLPPAALSAEDVYRWVDEQGLVHYGADPGADNAERIRIRSTKGDRAAERGEQDRAAMRRQAAEQGTGSRPRAGTDRDRVDRRRDALRCRQLQRQWQNIDRYGPLYYRNRTGGREFYTEEQRAAEKARVRNQVLEVCGEAPDG